MEQDKLNEVLQRNVAKLSKLSERERDMMPAGTAPMPSVEEVRRIVSLCKDIIFTDYFHKRQSDEKMRSYHIGVSMDELYNLLKRQIARGMQFCEDCDCSEEQILRSAEDLALQFIDQLPEVKRLLYTDVEAMFQSDPAATNYGEVIYCYPVMNTMTHYRIAHVLHLMEVPVIPRIITEQAHSRTGIDIHPGAKIGEYFAQHAKAAYQLMGADPVVTRCQYVLKAIRNAGLTELSKRDIMRQCRAIKKADELHPVLQRLCDYGYLAAIPGELKNGGGRPASQRYLVNPAVYH